MSRVFVRKASYDYPLLKPLLFEILDYFLKDRLTAHGTVIIKPNLLTTARPEDAVLTHPLVVRAVTEYCNLHGCCPSIADSPATGSFNKILRESGIYDAVRDLDVTFLELHNSLSVDIGRPFGKIDLAEDIVAADCIINLAKLKSHSQMLLSLGVKNCFGCVVGLRKAQWHMRAGIDRQLFARLIVQIYRAIKPALTIIDGITALEGSGPGKAGTPRFLGTLIASDDAVSCDYTVCHMLGLKPEKLPTNAAALKLGLAPESILFDGSIPHIHSFQLPLMTSLIYGPKAFQGFFRRHLLQRPAVNAKLCNHCGICEAYCPANAIVLGTSIPSFNYNECIRCYCCVEVCPQGAIASKKSLPGKLIDAIICR